MCCQNGTLFWIYLKTTGCPFIPTLTVTHWHFMNWTSLHPGRGQVLKIGGQMHNLKFKLDFNKILLMLIHIKRSILDCAHPDLYAWIKSMVEVLVTVSCGQCVMPVKSRLIPHGLIAAVTTLWVEITPQKQIKSLQCHLKLNCPLYIEIMFPSIIIILLWGFRTVTPTLILIGVTGLLNSALWQCRFDLARARCPFRNCQSHAGLKKKKEATVQYFCAIVTDD